MCFIPDPWQTPSLLSPGHLLLTWCAWPQDLCNFCLNLLLTWCALPQDLCNFLREKLDRRVDPEIFPDAILNGRRLDVFNLYKEVTRRGGFGCTPACLQLEYDIRISCL